MRFTQSTKAIVGAYYFPATIPIPDPKMQVFEVDFTWGTTKMNVAMKPFASKTFSLSNN